jgi:hypothetical protein
LTLLLLLLWRRLLLGLLWRRAGLWGSSSTCL